MNRLLGAGAGAVLTGAVLAATRTRPPSGAATWERTNFRGRSVSLTGGLSAAVGATIIGASAAAGHSMAAAAGVGLATSSAGAFGVVDDLDVDPAAARGFRGHLRALARGEVTTGGLKLLGISGCAVVAAALMTGAGRRGQSAPSVPARIADVLCSGALIAGSANLVNLFDLRPGRGVKAAVAIALPLALHRGSTGRLAAAATGVLVASARTDLREETMLGDTGANALGALLGSALAMHPRAGVRVAAVVAVVGLIGTSEKVSFSEVIADTPVLRAIDSWGRLP